MLKQANKKTISILVAIVIFFQMLFANNVNANENDLIKINKDNIKSLIDF